MILKDGVIVKCSLVLREKSKFSICIQKSIERQNLPFYGHYFGYFDGTISLKAVCNENFFYSVSHPTQLRRGTSLTVWSLAPWAKSPVTLAYFTDWPLLERPRQVVDYRNANRYHLNLWSMSAAVRLNRSSEWPPRRGEARRRIPSSALFGPPAGVDHRAQQTRIQIAPDAAGQAHFDRMGPFSGGHFSIASQTLRG